MRTHVEYGINLLPDALPSNERWLVIAAPPLFERMQRQLRALAANVQLTPGMDEPSLAAWERELPHASAILGIGGGVSMDAAKYAAWRRGLPLWLAPSVVSVDACLTEAIAVRREGRVRYIGEVYPRAVLVDYVLIRSAPAHLNRAGAGDILSIHTALWDWQSAARETGEHHDSHIADQSARLLLRLDEAAQEISAVTASGIKTLVELFAAEVALCRQAHSSRPEEGSEHFWAYNVEYRTRRNFVHGELVTLGVLLMAALQDNQLASARALAGRIGVRWRPEEVGLTRDEIIETMVTAREYAVTDPLRFSVLSARPVSPELARHIVQQVCDDP